MHDFVLTEVLNIPSSPVNVLGLSAFSKIIGDHDTKGTSVDLSGSDSIFTWDSKKYRHSFTHSEANMPELLVNDGFSRFHRFCNFIDTIQPIKRQCYNVVQPKSAMDSHGIPYAIGESVLYKKVDHVEKGVVEKIFLDSKTQSPCLEIKFGDGQRVEASMNNVMAIDESDISVIPNTAQEFVEHSKCLTAEDLKLLQHPVPLTKLQKEWKVLPDNFGHLPFAQMGKLVQHKILPQKFSKLRGKPILCPPCMFGRMRRRAWRSKGDKNVRQIQKQNEAFPRAKASADQLVVAQPGLVPRFDGKHTNERICGVTGFIDHHTGFSHSLLLTSLDGEQTIAAKKAFEQFLASCGVTVKAYRADNGRFAEKGFRDAVLAAHQQIDFCAVGQHNQNGIIERHFHRLTSQARTLLLHAKRHWPAMIFVILWPYAYKNAEFIYNNLHLDEDGLSPIQKFCGTSEMMDVGDVHTWGCPCYVLDKALQTAKMLPKWDPRSRLGVYLGHSPCHAGSVALVLNPKTLHFSPQFHVVFDHDFTTVPFLASQDVPPNWSQLVFYSASDEDYDLAKQWVDSQ